MLCVAKAPNGHTLSHAWTSLCCRWRGRCGHDGHVADASKAAGSIQQTGERAAVEGLALRWSAHSSANMLVEADASLRRYRRDVPTPGVDESRPSQTY